jgi:GDP-D-mannose dehydratase
MSALALIIPEYTVDITGTGTVRLLEALRPNRCKGKILSSLIQLNVWQGCRNTSDRENAIIPRSPYSCAKVLAYYKH